MSTVYVLEPPTKGKVVVNTTRGPIDIELWPKEAPKAVRNFVQLCLEGYYDNTIFHRVIKDFLVQCGDPTGTGTGGESIYGDVFADEFHSRIKFKHRGLVAMANSGTPNSNGSQFFITLDRCDWLDRKHTIFGKVTGDTMYNLLRLGEVETDKSDRPLDPAPKILSVEVLWNPFEDIVPRTLQKPETKATRDTDGKDAKRKGVKNLNLLSFGEETEEEEKELTLVKKKIVSSHDVLNDPRLLKDENATNELSSSDSKLKRDLQLSVRDALNSKKEEPQKDSGADKLSHVDSSDDDEADFDSRMRMQILKKRKELDDLPPKPKMKNGRSRSSPEKHSAPRARSDSVSADEEDLPRVEKLSMKKKGIGSEARAERMSNADTDMQLLNEAERGRHMQKQKKRRLQGREDEVLAKLEKFKTTKSAKETATTVESKHASSEELSDWRSVSLKFSSAAGKDHMARTENPNDYVVLDPLLEKGKEKFNKMQAKQKKREREWAGKSLT